MDGLNLESVGYVIVGAALVLKGALDKWAQSQQAKQSPPRPVCNCQWTAEDRKRLDELHRLHCGPASIDPEDGLLRWFCRDIARKLLNELQRLNERGG